MLVSPRCPVPVSPIIINRLPDRMRAPHRNATGPMYAVIDGRQSLATIRKNRLAPGNCPAKNHPW